MKQAPTRVFYGWYVVAGAFGITFIGFGSAYTFSAFFQPLTEAFGVSRGAISFVFSIAGCLYFTLGVVSGPLADRWGARRLAAFGMGLLGIGLVCAGLSRTLTQVFLSYGLGVGLGIGCAYVPVVGTVQRWFIRKRGLASGLAVSGIGVGTLMMPPIAAALIEGLGWRNAYVALGVSAAVGGMAFAMLIESDPSKRKLLPDGVERGTEPSATLQRPSVAIKQAVSSKSFATLYAGCLLSAFGVFVPFVHLVPDALDRGVEHASAILLVSIIGVGSTLGRFLLGSIADRMGRERFLVALYLGMAGTLGLWAAASGMASLAVFALSFGAVYGGWVAILPSVVMDRFGGANVSGIIGILYTSVSLGTLVGPTAAGYLYDASGSYQVTILVSIVANLAAAAVTLFGQRSVARH